MIDERMIYTRKLIAVILAMTLILSLGCVRAEEEQDNFLISDWTLVYALGDIAITEQTVFIYEGNTFEVMDEDETQSGTWTFDGETLTLTANGQSVSLKWDGEAYQFSGDYNGMTVTLHMPIEQEKSTVPAAGVLSGGWAVAEEPAVTEDISNLFFRALDSYQIGTITVAYTPVTLLGTQVVAGTNYAVLSKASEINQDSKWVIIYLYQDPEGNATVLNVADVELGV